MDLSKKTPWFTFLLATALPSLSRRATVSETSECEADEDIRGSCNILAILESFVWVHLFFRTIPIYTSVYSSRATTRSSVIDDLPKSDLIFTPQHWSVDFVVHSSISISRMTMKTFVIRTSKLNMKYLLDIENMCSRNGIDGNRDTDEEILSSRGRSARLWHRGIVPSATSV